MSPSKASPARKKPPRRSPARRSNRRLLAIGGPVAAIVVFAAIVIAVHLSTSGGSPSTPTSATSLSFVANAKAEFAGLPSKGNVVGYANAPVTVQEFGDLRCPICREFDASVIPTVLQKLVRTHKAKIQYRHWPILGPNSVLADHAAYAAMQQNKLWEFALVTYYNQGDENDNWFTKSFADAVASAIGLNLTQFNRDWANTAASTAEVAAVNKAAAALNFNGTPSVQVIGPKKSINLGASVPTYAQIAKAVTQVTPA
jgi:protein-disulfide isomerase